MNRQLANSLLFSLFWASLAIGGDAPAFGPDNPFYAKSTLPLQAPAFDKIKESDIKPALLEGMRIQEEEVRAIANNPAAPTFANTIVPLDLSGQLLSRVQAVFNALNSANTSDGIQKIDEETAPLLSAHADNIQLNPKLFKRIKTLYLKRHKLGLNQEEQHLITFFYDQMNLAGANLSAAKQEKLKKLNQEEASLSTLFGKKVLQGSNAAALVVDKAEDLAGLNPASLAAASAAAEAKGQKGKWLLPISNTTQQPALAELTKRETRQKLFEASWNRTERGDDNDTRATVLRMSAIRAERAALLGFKNTASLALKTRMAKTPEAVKKLFDSVVGPATSKAKEEAAAIQAVINEKAGGFTLEPWDWEFYAEQVRKAKYDLNEAEVRPYFELNRVLNDGVFYAAHLLYGLSFKERHDLPVYMPDVRVFDVFNKDGSQLGLFYCDYFARDNKRGGAWMSNFVDQSKALGQKPVVYNVTNFAKPAFGEPALLTSDNVKTMFHEFGHALHGLFGNQVYVSLSGSKTTRDWVEFPSQFNEHWATDPKVFANYAKHYKTGEPMPAALFEKIKKASTFNEGYNITEVLAASALDMEWHSLTTTNQPTDVDLFEKQALERTHLALREVPPRYRTSYFLHIWAGSYSAGYYAYTWTRILADDIYSWFEENGGLTEANGQRLRDMILSKGSTLDYDKMFKDFRGRAPSSDAYIKGRGFTAAKP